MSYFYDYYAKEYRSMHRENLLPMPLFDDIDSEQIRQCRKVLRNAFSGYRSGNHAEILKRFLEEYRAYISADTSEQAKNRYNAFVYYFMVPAHVGRKAIAKKLGVSMGTVWNYIDKALDELLAMCMGIPAAVERNDCTTYVRKIIDGSRLFESMSGEYIFELFPAHKGVIAQSRKHTESILSHFNMALNEYLEYCRDTKVSIDADIRKADVLMDCLAGASCGSIAEKYGCSEETVYSDIRENERKLAAMLFKNG